MKEHPLQGEFPLLQRLDAPSVVPAQLMRTATTYREACRLCWRLKRRDLTFRQLAFEAGVPYQHVTDYFNDDDAPHRRDVPGDAVKAIEASLGNTAISQWIAAGSDLTVAEEGIATARASA